MFPDDPPRFMVRIPHGNTTRVAIARDLVQGGFVGATEASVVAQRSRAESARIAAIAYCQGTPLRNEIEARDPHRLATATEAVAMEMARRFGSGSVDGKIQALVFDVAR